MNERRAIRYKIYNCTFHICFVGLALCIGVLSFSFRMEQNFASMILLHNKSANFIQPDKVCSGNVKSISVLLQNAMLFLYSGNANQANQCMEILVQYNGSSCLSLAIQTQIAAVMENWKQAALLSSSSAKCGQSFLSELSGIYSLAEVGEWTTALTQSQNLINMLRKNRLLAGTAEKIHTLLHIGQLKSYEDKSLEKQIALITEYWRLKKYKIVYRLASKLLLQSDQTLSSRRIAWLYFLIGDVNEQQDRYEESMKSYQSGVLADPSFLPNILGSIALIQRNPKLDTNGLSKTLTRLLAQIEPDGKIESSSVVSSLIGYTIIPDSDFAPEGEYRLYLFWDVVSPLASSVDVIRTDRWVIQQLSVYNIMSYGLFKSSEDSNLETTDWAKNIIPGAVFMQWHPHDSSYAMHLVPFSGQDRVVIGSAYPTFGYPVKENRFYLLTGKARVGNEGVVTVGCTWFRDTQSIDSKASGPRSYFQTYDREWRQLGILLAPPPEATGCEIRIGFLFGREGWATDVRLFELSSY